ncbi:MAG TPA: endonuclease/exonuclease/phosphatase family protein [Bryobacteraceae bacterium]|nr:endonuclease/exonuclease/phosphatase family protein [Bryobacteraceae bacterium]
MVRLGVILLAIGCMAEAQTLRVMSFNVRYPSKSDGPDLWEVRRDFLVDTLRKHAPDLIGTQELFHEQGQYIVAKLPDFAWFGVSRRGNKEDEHMGVFYRKDTLELLSSGNFWLSKTPDVPGSMDWDVTLPRMVTWGEFRHRKTGRRFHLYNTHFAHRALDENARVESARVLVDRISKLPPGTDLIVTGDFNTDVGSEPHNLLRTMLADAHEQASEKKGPTGSFHGFKGTPGSARIDWILFRGRMKPRFMHTLTDNREGRYPSDHFPVLAGFDLQP